MSYGKDERHIDKYIWKLPIPLYDASDANHRRLANLGQQQSTMVAGMGLDKGANFVASRRRVRAALAARPTASDISAMVTQMLDQ
jgi:hypothetical protein